MSQNELFLGVEYHLQQLADLRVTGVVLCHLDDAEPAALRHDVRAGAGGVRDGPGDTRLPQRPAPESGRALSRSASRRHRGL